MCPLQRLSPCLLALALFSGTSATAQRIASPARIVEKINDNQLVTLRGNTHPAASAQNDLGRVSPGLRLTDLILVLSRSPERQAAFDAFVASQYDPNSANFHQWLEPAEIGERFGPSQADIATISSWLVGRGLSVDEVANDRMTIRFSGSSRQVENAFHTEIHNLSVKGEAHIGNMTDPQIPMALDPVVAGVKALHNFFPKPMHRLGGKATLNPQTGKWERTPGSFATGKGLQSDAVSPRPELGINVGTTSAPNMIEDLTPYDYATIYNVLPLWNNASPIDGTGQTIAVTGTSDINAADVAQFRSVFGLPAGPALKQMKGVNGQDPGVCPSPSGTTYPCTVEDLIENSLDVEWAGAVAKNAQIILVTSAQKSASDDAIYDSSSYVVQNNVAKILNVSYGECELGMGAAGNLLYKNLWQTAATGGIAVFVASGDSGSPACDQGQGMPPYPAQFGLSVSGLASTAYNTAVGGTDFTWCNPNANNSNCAITSAWGATNNATTGANAQGYLAEIPWNDTCASPPGAAYLESVATAIQVSGVTDAETACSFIANYYQYLYNNYGANLAFFVNTEGAGGGASNCINGDGSTLASCTQGYPKPSWQTGVAGIPNDSRRDIPDVSFFAAAGLYNSAYLICVTYTGAACLSSVNPITPAGEPSSQEIGGTSAATPTMAGIMALINQKAGSPQGNPNGQLYTLAAKQTYSSCKSETGTVSNGCYFNDIDAGTIAMPCAPGSPNCTVTHSGDSLGILSGWAATTGFDLATGLGSLNVANVVNAWSASTGSAAATVTVTPAPTSILANQSMNVTVAVSGASGTPTGTVFVTGGGFNSATQPLTSGSFTFAIPANTLTVGTDTLKAQYSGDATYAPASGTANVTVTAPVLLTPTVTVTATSGSINSGQTLSVTAKVTGSGATPTGTVTLASGSYTSSATTLTAGSGTINIPANSLSAGTDTLTASYSGDSVYSTGSGTTSVTVTQSTFSLTATTPANINKGSAATSTVTVNTTNNYSGTVALSCALTSGPSNSSGDAPTCSASSGGVSPGSTGSATVSTRAATTSALERPALPGKIRGLLDGGAVLALLVMFGIPARRRAWRAMLGALVLMIAIGSLAACGGGGGGGGTSDPGTASGMYTFTVTGTGTPAQTSGNTTTFTVAVN
jgi:subtilase family serine protease